MPRRVKETAMNMLALAFALIGGLFTFVVILAAAISTKWYWRGYL